MVNEELIKHKIQVDEHISMDIMIPKTMNALQFKGLTMKANKLFNLSEASVDILPIKEKNVSKRIYFTSEQQLFLMRKFVVDKIQISKIPVLFKEKYPDSEKKANSLQTAIYNMRSIKHKFYLQALEEKQEKI